MTLRAFRIPITWPALIKRTAVEVMADDCLGLAAQLAYYFFLALFPALLFLVAFISFMPVGGLLDAITALLARVAPGEVLSIVQEQVLKIANDKSAGLLTVGMLGTIWSTSSGMTAIIDTLNKAYDLQESRPWWKVRLLAIGLTIALAAFIVVSMALVLVGPTFAEKVAVWAHLGPVFMWTWTILQWPVVFALVTLAIGLIYYFAPDAEQEWVWRHAHTRHRARELRRRCRPAARAGACPARTAIYRLGADRRRLRGGRAAGVLEAPIARHQGPFVTEQRHAQYDLSEKKRLRQCRATACEAGARYQRKNARGVGPQRQ